MNDLISRQALCEYALNQKDKSVTPNDIMRFPSAQPKPSDITDEQAILHLQSTGWMQNHDREMYECGLKKRLADDSGDYDSLIPCEDTISRQQAITALRALSDDDGYINVPHEVVTDVVRGLPPVQPGHKQTTHSEHTETDKLWVKTGGTWINVTCPNCGCEIHIKSPAQPESCEITDEQAIEHLQSTGWMQNHDRQMYEMWLKEQLADDSGSYDSLIPNKDCISRQAAIDAVGSMLRRKFGIGGDLAEITLAGLPSAQPQSITCDGCKHVGTYDTDFPCSSCIRREKDYYEPDE